MQCSCAILSSVACAAVQYFSTLSHRGHDFLGGGGGVFEREMCVLILSTVFARVVSRSKENAAR